MLFLHLALPSLFNVVCVCVCVCWILSTLARLTAPAGVDLIQLVHTHREKKHLFGTKCTHTQTWIQSAHSLGSTRTHTQIHCAHPFTRAHTQTPARTHPAYRACTHINTIWKWRWASVWTALAHSVFVKHWQGPHIGHEKRFYCSRVTGWPSSRPIVCLSHPHAHTLSTADTAMQIQCHPLLLTPPLSFPKSPIKSSCF